MNAQKEGHAGRDELKRGGGTRVMLYELLSVKVLRQEDALVGKPAFMLHPI